MRVTSQEYNEAVAKLYDNARLHPGTSTAKRSAQLLMALYNGGEAQIDLHGIATNFDSSNLRAVMNAIAGFKHYRLDHLNQENLELIRKAA